MPSSKSDSVLQYIRTVAAADGRSDTDATGVARVELPKSFYILRLWSSKKPYVEMFSDWEQNELASGVKVPAEYTMRLETGVTAGGRVVDEQGKPIVGAKVQVSVFGDQKPVRGDGRTMYNTWLAGRDDGPTTDADGRWQIANVPDHPQTELAILVTHADFVSDELWQQGQKAAGVNTAMLRNGTATVTLKRRRHGHGASDGLGPPTNQGCNRYSWR